MVRPEDESVSREGGANLDGLPLSTPPELRELFGRVLDREHVLGVLRRELPAASDGPIRVASCDAKARFHRDFVRASQLLVVYRVGIEVAGAEREFVFLGVSPVTPGYLDEIQARARGLRGHPWVAPFGRLTWFVEDLRLALLLFPLDPALPALAELTGSDGARVLAACSSAPLAPDGGRLACELLRYNPLDRAVLRVRTGPGRDGSEHNVYAKLFADESGAAKHADLVALWSVARGSRHLCVPEPLGYAPEQRVLLMGEARGERALNAWIKCVERGEPLPPGVDLARLERCILVAAEALLELQGSGLVPATRRVFRDELAQLEQDRVLLQGMRAREPGLVARAESLLRRLAALAPAHETLVPSHGSFRHKQMLGDDDGLTVIDWDGFCLANPALDAATFLGRLRREAVTGSEYAPVLERMAGAFRDRLIDRRPPIGEHLALYDGLVLTEQVLRAFRRPGASTAARIRDLATAAEEALARAEAGVEVG